VTPDRLWPFRPPENPQQSGRLEHRCGIATACRRIFRPQRARLRALTGFPSLSEG
jgi:hypothetical protein